MSVFENFLEKLHSGRKEDILSILHEESIDVLISCAENTGYHLLHEVCCHDYPDIVHLLLQYGVNPEECNSQNQTALQVAAENGCFHVVSYLLGSEACDLGKYPLLSESSPLLLATKHGHIHVVEELLEFIHSELKSFKECLFEDDIKSLFFYTACLSGNVEMVKFWYGFINPDLNQPIAIVTDLSNCEDLIPLHAACTVKSISVIKFLLNNGAVIKESVTDNFPDLMAEALIGAEIKSTDQSKEVIIDLQNKRLEKIPSSWLQLDTITHLNISTNFLNHLPSCLPWQALHLCSFKVSNNNLQHIPDPPEGWKPEECKLCHIDLSQNGLQKLPHAIFQLPKLQYLYLQKNSIRWLYQADIDKELLTPSERMKLFKDGKGEHGKWKCDNLIEMNVSNNGLEILSDDLLKWCPQLTTLIARENNLFKFPTPWQCSLTVLDLRNNNIKMIPPTLAQFWNKTLETLLLSHNQISELPESVVKLYALQTLDVSHNSLSSLPPAEIWLCDRLEKLYLGYNKLSSAPATPTRETSNRFSFFPSRSKSFSDVDVGTWFELPERLNDHLRYLYLNDNSLQSVPPSLYNLTRLHVLDLHNNPQLSWVPNELALLTSCNVMNFEGCGIPEKCIPKQLITEATLDSHGLLAHLRKALRKCVSSERIKIIVLGKERMGKTSIVNALSGNPAKKPTLHTNLSVHQIRLSPPVSEKQKLPEIVCSLWDFPGYKYLADVHQCFLSENTLYLLVWDVTTGQTGIEQLETWLQVIQSRIPRSTVIIVGTHLDKLPLDNIERMMILQDHTTCIRSRYSEKHFPTIGAIMFVSCCPGDVQGISQLQEAIYTTSCKLTEHGSSINRNKPWIGKQVPKSYMDLEVLLKKEAERRVAMMEPPILIQEEFHLILEKVPGSDFESHTELTEALKYFHDLGEVLHFHDQLRGLNCLYFLNPEWLCDLLSQVLVNKEAIHHTHNGIILKDKLTLVFEADKFPHSFLEQYIQLLERFEIALTLDSEKLLIPCKLSEVKFGSLDLCRAKGQTTYRFYRTQCIPSGFWGRLITKILVGVNRFTDSHWRMNNSQSHKQGRVLGHKTSFHQPLRRRNSEGLFLKKVNAIYWREGMKVSHDHGQFIVESAQWIDAQPQRLTKTNTGILITVISTSGNFSALSFLVDEIESLFEEWYKGSEEGVQIAICPLCCEDNPNLVHDRESLGDMTHFSVTLCAALCTSQQYIKCPVKNTEVALNKLVPDLVLADLPKKLHMVSENLVVDVSETNCLGRGSFGFVYKGTYEGKTVAVKIFPIGLSDLIQDREENQNNMAATDNEKSFTRHDDSEECPSESHGLKVLYSLTEIRKEVSLLSRLNHPCIVSFIGVCLSPACIILELAPLGNLREIIDKEMNQDLLHYNLPKIKDQVFGTVFSRQLTFKVIVQVAKALQYLHRNNVIYRDLKPANVLVWSMNLDHLVNVKLSDYSISKFSTLQGLLGNCGSVGYQAPEVTTGVAYDEQVDMFSLGIVMYEVLTGVLPYNRNIIASKITQSIREGVRPKLQTNNYRVVTDLPCLEKMMERCWQTDPCLRPTANHLIHLLKQPSFLCLKKELTGTATGQHDRIIYMLTYPNEKLDGDLAWLWEGHGRNRVYHILDISVGQYKVWRAKAPGPLVTCMCKVNQSMWLGNQSKMIEVFGPKGAGVPVCLGTFDLPAVPTQLLCYKDSVYCGLNTGKLMQFSKTQRNPVLRKQSSEELSWNVTDSLLLDENHSVSSMVSVNQDSEVWISSGFNIFTVTGNPLRLVTSICLKDLSLVNTTIVSMVTDNYKIWCCFQGDFKVVEVDTQSRCITCVFTCDNPSVKDIISSTLKQPGCSNTPDTGEQDEVSSHVSQLPTLPPRAPLTNQKLSKGGARLEGVTDAAPVPNRASKPRNLLSSAEPYRQKSRTLPNISASEGVGKTRGALLRQNSKSFTEGLSVKEHVPLRESVKVVVIKDTLWIVDLSGIISVVSISNQESYGQVICQLTSENVCNGKLVDLHSTKSGCVISAHIDQTDKSSLLIWEGWDTKDVSQFYRFFTDLQQVEQQLKSNPSL